MRIPRLVAALGLVLMSVLTLAGPALAADPISPPTTTRVTPYYGGHSLTWTAFDQEGLGGPGSQPSAILNGVSGGTMGIVETGRDPLSNEAASWVSADGGKTWREHITPSETSFGPVVGHAGVLVTTGSGFYSSTDGASWISALTGPHGISMVKLAAGPSGFVAFVRDGKSTTTRVWRSVAGRSWTVSPVQSVVSGFCPTSIAGTSSRIVAIGVDCANHRTAKVLVSTNGGRTWTVGWVPSGLRVTGAFVRAPSVSYVGGRFLVTGANATQTATWVWSSTNGLSWRHTSSMPRTTNGSFTVDRIVGIFKLGSGYLAIGDRDMPADDAVLVAWRSSDLVHWSRFSPPTAGCDATVHQVNQANIVGTRLVAVGNPWSIGSQCGETWMARVTP
jgi:hypothetical protein